MIDKGTHRFIMRENRLLNRVLKMTEKNNSLSRSGGAVGLFLAALVLFNFPIISLFDRNSLLFGIPLLYLYLFLIWSLVIFAVYRHSVSRTSRKRKQ